MRKMLLFVIVFWIFASTLAINLYVFEDATLFWKELSDGYELPEDVNVTFVDGASWWVEEKKVPQDWIQVLKEVTLYPAEKFDFEKYFSKDLVEMIKNESKVKIVNFNPMILHFPGTNLYKVNLGETDTSSGWYYFFWDNVEKRILHLSQKSDVLLSCPGNWKAVYTFADERELSLTVKIKSLCVDEGYVYLVTGKMYEKGRVAEDVLKVTKSVSSAPVVEEAYERKIYEIGDVKGLISGTNYKVFDALIRQVEKVYEITLPITRSVPYQKTLYTLRIENSRSNGLGFPLPDGEVIVFKTVGGGSVPIGNFIVKGAVENGTVKIIENKSSDVLVKLSLLSSKKIDDRTYRKELKVEIRNYKDDEVKVEIVITGSMLNYVDGDFDPEEATSDYLRFLLDVESGVTTFKVVVDTSW